MKVIYKIVTSSCFIIFVRRLSSVKFIIVYMYLRFDEVNRHSLVAKKFCPPFSYICDSNNTKLWISLCLGNVVSTKKLEFEDSNFKIYFSF